jgi:hypothetical protein
MQMKKILLKIKERAYWRQHQHELSSIGGMEEFLEYVRCVQPAEFLKYRTLSPEKRLDFETVMNELHVDLKGIRFLDIGTGYGDSLDICHEHGARDVDFIELDPFFYTYNHLKKFTKGYQLDLYYKLHKLEQGKYDLIWVKGPFSADTFINKAFILPSLSRWLTHVEKLAAPAGAIVICPHWWNNTQTRTIENVRSNPFTDTMLQHGYMILPPIKHHNRDPEYPITFYKRSVPSSVRQPS